MPPTAPAPAPDSSLPGVFALVSEGIRIFRERLSALLTIGAFAFVVQLVLSYVAPRGPQNQLTLPFGVWSVVGIIVAALLLICLSFARVLAVADTNHIGWSAALRDATMRFFGYIWVSILVGVAILAALIVVVGIPGGILAFLAWKLAGGAGLSLIAVIAVIAALVVSVVVSTWFSLAIWLYAVGTAKGTDALRESRQLVRGRVGKVFGRFVGIGIVMILMSIPLWIVDVIFGVALSSGAAAVVVAVISNAYTALLITPISIGSAFALFRHLR